MRLTTKLSGLVLIATWGVASVALAQHSPTPSGECTGNGGACGAPKQSGGGCGCGCGGSILINYTDQGDTYQYADDFDDDAWEDNEDNCPFANNPEQIDADGDGFGDPCDNAPGVANPDQIDSDADGLGDVDDPDADDDLLPNDADDCLGVPNPGQEDADGDGRGDACDDDDDDDGCADTVDNCPLIRPGQGGTPGDDCLATLAIVPNECDHDADADHISDAKDNCSGVPNASQGDADGDGIGDDCDHDLDNDGVDNTQDSCPQVPNTTQANKDRDGFGDACDSHDCFVVDTEDKCLDLAAPFTVHAGREVETLTGIDNQLHLFSNRAGKAIRYSYTIVSQPESGSAEIRFPKGAVSFAPDGTFESRFENDKAPHIRALIPGIYVVKLHGELAFDDDQYPGQKAADAEVTINVGGDAINGCRCVSVGDTSPWAFALVLGGMVGVTVRRRRRA